jgi:hypothetical protein
VEQACGQEAFASESTKMSNNDREHVQEQVRAMLAEWGIDLDTHYHWVVEGLNQPARFFEHLPTLLPSDSILYVEGTSILAEIAEFYRAHRATNPIDVARDTLVPVPDTYHIALSPEVSNRLCRLAQSHPTEELFDHIKAYQQDSLLLTFHDAFRGSLRISEHVPRGAVREFCEKLGVSFHREETERRNPEQLRRMLQVFEQPNQLKIRVEGESWLSKFRRWIHLRR